MAKHMMANHQKNNINTQINVFQQKHLAKKNKRKKHLSAFKDSTIPYLSPALFQDVHKVTKLQCEFSCNSRL